MQLELAQFFAIHFHFPTMFECIRDAGTKGGGQGGPQIVADQITLSQQGGLIIAPHITPGPLRFSDLPASLDPMHLIKNGNIPSVHVPQPLH